MNQFELFFPRGAAAAASAFPMALSQQHEAMVLPEPSFPGAAPEEPFRFENVEVEDRVGYTVRLADYSHPVADAVKVAEQRFRREIGGHSSMRTTSPTWHALPSSWAW